MEKNDRAAAAPSGRLICPRCGSEMNRHAEKIDFGAGLVDASAQDASVGGLLVEFHTCPNAGCKHVLERLAR